MRHYLIRLVVFNCLWMLLVVAASLAAHVVVPDPDFVPFWAVVLSPIGYALGVVVSTPIAIVVGIVTWTLASLNGQSRRSLAVSATLLVWATVLLVTVIGRAFDDRTISESAITLGLSIPLFALLMPLPGPAAPATISPESPS